MSHAWNACGANAPRGFKSHILRPITPVLSQSRGFALRRPPPGLAATSTQKNSAPHHPDRFSITFPTPPPNRGMNRPKRPFQVQSLGALAGSKRALRPLTTMATNPTPVRGRNCVSLVLKSRQLPGAPHIYSEYRTLADSIFPHGHYPRIGLAT